MKQMRKSGKRDFGLSITVHVALLVLFWTLYRRFGTQAVLWFYRGELFGFSGLAARMRNYPALKYCIDADRIFLALFLSGTALLPFVLIARAFRAARKNAPATRPGAGVAAYGKPLRTRQKIALAAGVALLVTAFFLWRHYNLLHVLKHYRVVTEPSYQELTFPGLNSEEILLLGGGHAGDDILKSSYITFPVEKKPGVTRIGLFGCSMIRNAGVAEDHDVGSFLQKMFDDAGIENVEVINFGLSARGVGQMCLMWELLGRDYDLDYVILFPFEFHKQRDSTFSSGLISNFGPVYARFIIENGALKLIPVAGKDRLDACMIYHRIFPPLRYIRYDRKLPMFLKILLPRIFHNKVNPFYYMKGVPQSEEMATLYSLLFNRMARQAKHLIVVTDDGSITGHRDRIRSPNTYFLESQAMSHFDSGVYYITSGRHVWHHSALGNYLRAKELFDLLTGRSRPELPIVRLSAFEGDGGAALPCAKPLFDSESISVEIGRREVSFLKGKKTAPDNWLGEENVKLDLGGHKIASLLFLPGPRHMRRLRSIPLTSLVKDKANVSLTLMIDGRPIDVPLGVIRSPHGVVGTISWDPEKNKGLHRKGDGWDMAIKRSRVYLQTTGMIDDVFLSTGRTRILGSHDLRRNKLYNLLSKPLLGRTSFSGVLKKPHRSIFVYLKKKKEHFIDVNTLAREGTLDLVVRDEAHREERYPIFSYAIVPAGTKPFDPFPLPVIE